MPEDERVGTKGLQKFPKIGFCIMNFFIRVISANLYTILIIKFKNMEREIEILFNIIFIYSWYKSKCY